jgi:hypothetical protein
MSFKHGWFYHYRVHNPKTSSLSVDNLSSLKVFLDDMFENCPHDYFQGGPRGSALKFKIPNIDPVCLTGHEVSSLADLGLVHNADRFKSNHSKVQLFMLENDQNTVALEIPIWLESKELDCYKQLFKCDEPLTGHIDALRVQDGNVWVWDYKPNAHKEKYAITQTYFYALMLSKRTGIPLEKFRCGYFDKYYAYVFKPELDVLESQELLSNF